MSHYPKPKKRTINTEIAPPRRNAIEDPAVWVQLLRGSCGWSQEEFAEAAGMHPSQISAYETGLKIPRPATRVRLAAAAGTTPEAVIEAAEVLRRRMRRVVGTSIAKRAASIGERTRREAEAAFERVLELFELK